MIDRLDKTVRDSTLTTLVLTVFALCVLTEGCRDVATTWSADALSPDGKWLATARTQQWGGPGTAYDATTVNLRQVNASQASTQILVFSHQYATINLKMEWATPTHLDVAYGASASANDRVSLDFQVAKISGVEISVHEVPKAESNASHSAQP